MNNFSVQQYDQLARRLLEECQHRHCFLCCAESLTGGLLSDAFVRIPGASQVYRGSVNTYALDTKTALLGVNAQWLSQNGAVNAYTAEHMAVGAIELFRPRNLSSINEISHSSGFIALSTTGVAGPGPDGDIPAGRVFIGCAYDTTQGMSISSCQYDINGNREEVRRQTVAHAIEFALTCIQQM